MKHGPDTKETNHPKKLEKIKDKGKLVVVFAEILKFAKRGRILGPFSKDQYIDFKSDFGFFMTNTPGNNARIPVMSNLFTIKKGN